MKSAQSLLRAAGTQLFEVCKQGAVVCAEQCFVGVGYAVFVERNCRGGAAQGVAHTVGDASELQGQTVVAAA